MGSNIYHAKNYLLFSSWEFQEDFFAWRFGSFSQMHLSHLKAALKNVNLYVCHHPKYFNRSRKFLGDHLSIRTLGTTTSTLVQNPVTY